MLGNAIAILGPLMDSAQRSLAVHPRDLGFGKKLCDEIELCLCFCAFN